ncbi:MAG: ribonuclease P protein component [Clostridia bacterium]|nr:ribonuclease P protein component [Clostridia bacterium]
MKHTESLKKNYEFARVYKKGKYYRARNLTLYILNDNKDRKRIGITVSRKSYGRSVDRNRIRRLVRESYRSFEDKIEKNADMVFVIRKNSELPSFKIINDEVEYLLKQSGLM